MPYSPSCGRMGPCLNNLKGQIAPWLYVTSETVLLLRHQRAEKLSNRKAAFSFRISRLFHTSPQRWFRLCQWTRTLATASKESKTPLSLQYQHVVNYRILRRQSQILIIQLQLLIYTKNNNRHIHRLPHTHLFQKPPQDPPFQYGLQITHSTFSFTAPSCFICYCRSLSTMYYNYFYYYHCQYKNNMY